ncbi:hypothetical protein SAPIO_CDS1802 [Scedosporium apiospermum]|uniref:Fungal-type protein kinase domain-containing protein n=1 Tax=Pseudallescheria apiosperma TaxID=563466 RepID=A0A084GDS2_PSEDA|nr:uncharacterized protein SAPIO_CDS1802 [Scedosporium apiospermum]KEZ45484.1 hypothetical protein SAPIO_CDS1802 [Scedosporium apiospermum]
MVLPSSEFLVANLRQFPHLFCFERLDALGQQRNSTQYTGMDEERSRNGSVTTGACQIGLLADQPWWEVIKGNPLKNVLDPFRASFNTIYGGRSTSGAPDALDQFGSQGTGPGKLRSYLLKLNSAVSCDDFDFDCIKPLLNAALADPPNDALIWDQVCSVDGPVQQTVVPSLPQATWLRNPNSFATSSEYQKYIDVVLKEDLRLTNVALPDFYECFFGDVADLELVSQAVFEKCMEGRNPLYSEGWRGWAANANQEDVLTWFAELSENLAAFAEEYKPNSTQRRRPVARPQKPVNGLTAGRAMDVAFVSDPEAGKDARCPLQQVLVPGELESNSATAMLSNSWLDLGRYAREVLAAQDTRRFVLGFTICGPLMSIWEFDRLGAVASEQFNINKDGLRFLCTILGFLRMSEEKLGFDPTIGRAGSQRFIEIERNAGRATTCWKAHRKEDSRKTPLVIKDSWQLIGREEEGKLLREVTDRGVTNVARYYYHDTVRVGGRTDDIWYNIRAGLDAAATTNYRLEPPSTSKPGNLRNSYGSQTDTPLPLSTRSCSVYPHQSSSNALPNRVHRRVILRDYGKPIYEASSRAALLAALEGCIVGHESLRKAGFLHGDISIYNLMVNEDKENPSWPSFLIDTDLATKESRGEASPTGSKAMKAFRAIGILLGEPRCFMHDLESFFWVLFWICIHYDAPGQYTGPTVFDSWNFEDDSSVRILREARKDNVVLAGV